MTIMNKLKVKKRQVKGDRVNHFAIPKPIYNVRYPDLFSDCIFFAGILSLQKGWLGVSKFLLLGELAPVG